MNEYTITTAFLRETEPFLNEYFGIGYGYFERDFCNREEYFQIKTEVGESPTLKFIEEDHDFPIYTSFVWDDFLPLFDFIEENDEADADIVKALFMLAYVIRMKDFAWMLDNPDYTDYIEYNIVREDLLRLYLFANERKSDTAQGQKISLKHAIGSVDIKNYENWFTRKLLTDYLNRYLADITSIEQAESELEKYKKQAGRKIKDNRIHIVLYGIFRMFNENKKMKSPQSDSLCGFIIAYLQKTHLNESITR